MNLEFFLESQLGISYGIFIILGLLMIILGSLGSRAAKRKTILNNLEKRTDNNGLIDKMLNRFNWITKSEAKLDKQLSVLDMKYKARMLTKAKIVLIIFSFFVALYFENWMIFIPLMIIFSSIPDTVIEIKTKKRIELYDEQILEAIQIFITDYTTTKNAFKTLTEIGPKLKYPIRKEFERLARNMNSGMDPELALMEFSSRLCNKWATIFAQLLITYARTGGNFVPHMLSVTKNITEERVTTELNTTELSSLRLMNILMNALVPIAYIINTFINPDNARVFIDTSGGKTILFAVVIGCFISLYLGKKITQY